MSSSTQVAAVPHAGTFVASFDNQESATDFVASSKADYVSTQIQSALSGEGKIVYMA